MSDQHTPYDYETRTGVYAISWQDFAALSRRLAELLAAQGVDMIVGVARAGLLPATTVAAALECDLTPVRLTRRERGKVVRERPEWKADVSDEVAGRVVGVIDEMASTGESLALVAQRVRAKGAAKVISASLCAHTWASPTPDAVALVSDAFVIFPWDTHLYREGVWIENPEIVEALATLNVQLDFDKPLE